MQAVKCFYTYSMLSGCDIVSRVLTHYTMRLGFCYHCARKPDLCMATLPVQGNGEPASDILHSNISLLSHTEQALNCRYYVLMRERKHTLLHGFV